MIYTAIFSVVNSDPNVYASTELYLLLNYIIGALLQNNEISVWDSILLVSPAWFVLTKQCVNMKLPICTGMFPVIASLASQ